MSTRPEARGEKAQLRALLRELEGRVSPELYAFLRGVWDGFEEQEQWRIRLEEKLEDHGIAP